MPNYKFENISFIIGKKEIHYVNYVASKNTPS